MAQTLKVNSPHDGHPIIEYPLSSLEEAQLKLDKAYKLFHNKSMWLKPYERAAILEKLIEKMKNQREELAKIAAEEGGKPLVDSLVEVDRAIIGVRKSIEEFNQMGGVEIPMNLTTSSSGRMAYTMREPVGVVLSISAFNHPLNLVVHQVIPAIMAGCPVLIKPALTTPRSCFNLIKLLYECGLAEEHCQSFVCDNEVTEKLVRSDKIRFMSFIGSAKVGWYLKSILAPGVGCALEHGGAAPVIFEADGDIQDALPLLVKGAYYHAGQVCVSVQRVFVHESIVEVFTSEILNKVKSLQVGDPLSEKTDLGPLIRHQEVDRVDSWVKEAVLVGAKLLLGGKKISDSYYEPTLLLNPTSESKVSKEEIFGPVICLYSYKSREEAISQANDTPFNFQASVFSKDIDVVLDTVRKLRAVTVMVNDHTAFRVDWMPFGGADYSGLGMGGMKYFLRDILKEKLMIIRSKSLI